MSKLFVTIRKAKGSLMRSILSCALMITLGACTGDRAEGPRVVTRDSLGITISESSRPALEGEDRFRITSEPTLSIGVVEGAEAFMFRQIRGVVRLSDGRIVVSDRGSQEVRYFSAAGSHLMTVGGPGGGPGEFRGLSGLMRLAADSVWAHDGGALRFALLDPDGRVTATGSTGTPPTVIGRFADGSLIYTVYARAEDAGATDGYLRPPMAVMRLLPNGETISTITEIPGTEEYRVTDAGRVFTFAAPFAQRQIAVVSGDRLYTVADDGHEITIYDSSGALDRLIRTMSQPRRVTAADVAAYRDAVLARYSVPSASSELHERVLSEADYPTVMPVYRDLRVDADGYIWAELYRLPDETAPVWRVFDDRGEWLRDLPTPRGLEIFELGSDYVLGVWTDELGVEYVHLYGIER